MNRLEKKLLRTVYILKNRKRLPLCLLLINALVLIASCKNNWLDVKPSKSLVVPTAIGDFQAILDNSNLFNIDHPGLAELSADNYYLTFAAWQAANSNRERNSYLWADDIYEGETKNSDWDKAFRRILYSNIVLEGIEKVELNNGSTRESQQIRGSAYFIRALDYYNLAQVFCLAYSPLTAGKSLGLPLRLASDVNKQYSRSSLEETYEQVLKDLNTASLLLSDTVTYKTRPSRSAAFALMSRVYMSMGRYREALNYADSTLQINNTLLDFNDIDSSKQYPVELMNKEVIYHCTTIIYGINSRSNFNVDSTLFRSYQDNDLRRAIFYHNQNGEIKYKGSYSGSYDFFGGLAVDEIYLIRAECNARLGNVPAAIADLNTLMKHRWKAGTFAPFVESDSKAAIAIILDERRKELVFRGLRWTDLKRLNILYPDQAITLNRTLDNVGYSLSPNSPKYALPIAQDEIRLGGLEQNPR